MKIISYSVLALFLFTVFGNCKVVEKDTPITTRFFIENVLVNYGAEVYKRELCASCHTQQIDEEKLGLISLDGLKGQYPNRWVYDYLYDPQMMNSGVIMVSYSHLYSRQLSRQTLDRLIGGEKLRSEKINTDSIWDALINQADIFFEELNIGVPVSTPSDTKYSEALALVAYLKQIPSSPSKLKLDSIAEVKALEEKKALEIMLLDSNSIIVRTANNKAYISEGMAVFSRNCTPCHLKNGGGGIGPNLTDDYWLHGGKKTDIARIIINGVPEKGMISWRNHLSLKEVGALVAYLSSLKGTNPENAKAPQGAKESN